MQRGRGGLARVEGGAGDGHGRAAGGRRAGPGDGPLPARRAARRRRLRHGLRRPRRAPRPARGGEGHPRRRRRRRSARSARPARSRGSTTRAIVALFDAGEEDGCRYLVSELVEGRTLAQLEADGALSDRDVLRVGLALADALAHAHDRGVIHRDVKPQNVIVPDEAGSRRGAAKLTDFGVAHLAGEDALTRTGDVVGTLAYMAPEQAAGRRRAASTPTSTRSASCSTRRSPACTRSAPARRPRPRGASARVLAPLARHRADLPRGLCAAIDRAVLPGAGGARRARRPLRRAGRRAARGLRRGRDDRAAPARAPACRRCRPRSAASLAPAATGALASAALARADARARRPRPSPSPPAPRRLTAVLPRAGLARRRPLAVAGLLAFAPAPRPGAALLVALLALAPALLLRRDGRAWALPAAAPLLGLAGPRRRLSGARRPARRAGPPAPRSARSAPGGSCSPSRCWSARWCSAPAPGTPARAPFDGARGHHRRRRDRARR